MHYDDLTPEQQEKARACKTPQDFLALAEEEGYVLSDEELNSISAGDGIWDCFTDGGFNPGCHGLGPIIP